MTQKGSTDPLVTGIKSAIVHFSKAAIEVASGVGSLVTGITRTMRSDDERDDVEDGRQRIEVE
ncbi:MAG: hypothetical protein QGD89_01440 [Actinomycetota bacterium]|nr:hypothetical protein [Actinomycetota bacterium]